ncbi:uncharacterized protein [Euphorbia lathyris]|uniref:uncharacterized protein n=1 Tax=Euphorbia lathyris TaxID=212925 RepID=UPI0033141EF5
MVDSGYPNTFGYLSPIRDFGVRCHMPEFRCGKPRGMEEHYNHLHSSLRMKVEMAFGQLKKRWKVLHNMPQMSKKYQMSIIVSTFTLHNFIRLSMLGIPIIQHGPNVNGIVDSDMFNIDRKDAMLAVRNGIAQQIWQSRLAENKVGVENELDDDDEVSKDD